MGVLTKYSKKMARKSSKRKPMMKFTKGGKYKKTDYSSLLVRPDTEDETDGISLGDSDSFNEDSMEEFIVDDDNTESDSWTSSSSDHTEESSTEESSDGADDFVVKDARAEIPKKSFRNPYLNRREINLDEYTYLIENLLREKLGYPYRKSSGESKLESSIDYACSKLMTGAWNARAVKIIKESTRWDCVQLDDSQRRNAKIPLIMFH